jgi:hypothetical protein
MPSHVKSREDRFHEEDHCHALGLHKNKLRGSGDVWSACSPDSIQMGISLRIWDLTNQTGKFSGIEWDKSWYISLIVHTNQDLQNWDSSKVVSVEPSIIHFGGGCKNFSPYTHRNLKIVGEIDPYLYKCISTYQSIWLWLKSMAMESWIYVRIFGS